MLGIDRQKYALGIYVEPDSVSEIATGMKLILSEPINPAWERYEMENSWHRNAELVVQAFNGNGT